MILFLSFWVAALACLDSSSNWLGVFSSKDVSCGVGSLFIYFPAFRKIDLFFIVYHIFGDFSRYEMCFFYKIFMNY